MWKFSLPLLLRALLRRFSPEVCFPTGMMLGCLLLASPLHAQTVNTYSNTTTGTINGTTTCTAPLVRNFSVGTSFTVSDVDIGILATHSWRGDMRMTLQSPAGTRVQIVNGDTSNNGNADNFNVRLNDASSGGVVNASNVNHSTSAPPYENNLQPNNALSAFNGQNSLGTWRLEICDLFPSSDNGQFVRADLYLTVQPTVYADLSVNKTVSSTSPTSGSNVTFTLSVTNASGSPNSATGVVVRDLLPAGVTFVSSSGTGSYNNTTGDWAIGTIAPGQTRTRTIVARVTASSGATVTNTAEVTASSQPDIDSTVNNGVTTEDDYATASFTVSGARTAGTPPTLVCPAGQSVFDWDTKTWTAGSLSNSYTQAGVGLVNVVLSNVVYQTRGGSATPFLDNAFFTGGLVPTQKALVYAVDFVDTAQTQTAVFTFPTTLGGVQFTLFDIDYQAGAYSDKVIVTGTYQGSAVIPVLTNGVTNYVVGNAAVGDVIADNNSAIGNVVVTFNSPVDSITVVYTNEPSLAPANPTGQTMGIHDLTYCNPQANLSVTKVSSILSDPVNGTTDPKLIPGALVQYCILIANSGSATASNITANDTLPGDVTFSAGTIRSGTNCASAATVEDDNATGADESDPFGASFNAGVLSATAATLGPAANFALTFQVTVD